MSKELLKPHDYCKSESAWSGEALVLNEHQKKELAELYEGSAQQFKQGNIIKGTVLKAMLMVFLLILTINLMV